MTLAEYYTELTDILKKRAVDLQIDARTVIIDGKLELAKQVLAQLDECQSIRKTVNEIMKKHLAEERGIL